MNKENRKYSIQYQEYYEPYIIVKNDEFLCEYDENLNMREEVH